MYRDNDRTMYQNRMGFRAIPAGWLVWLAILLLGVFTLVTAKADDQYALIGNMSKTTSFKVRSLGGDAFFDLESKFGTACVEDRSALGFSYGEKLEFDHGFYYVSVYEKSSVTVYRWVPSATTNEEGAVTESWFRIYLPVAGDYLVFVEPMDAETINTYWKHDRFLGWEDGHHAIWNVGFSNQCYFNDAIDQLDGRTQVPSYDHATVPVYCYEGTVLLESYEITIYESQMVYPKELAGYPEHTAGVWVNFDSTTGETDPVSVRFYYYRSSSDPNDDEEVIIFDSPTGLPVLPKYGEAAYAEAPYVNMEYIQFRCGPGDNYPEFYLTAGGKRLYRNDEITRADIYFTTGNWVYVGFGYSDKNWRCGFFGKEWFTPYDGWDIIPEFSLDTEKPGTIIQSTVPRNYPQWDGGDAYESCTLYVGDTVYACVEYDGWYLCRFFNGHDSCYGDVYLWIPGSAISFY